MNPTKRDTLNKIVQLAKSIRQDGESYRSAISRASKQLKNERNEPSSDSNERGNS